MISKLGNTANSTLAIYTVLPLRTDPAHDGAQTMFVRAWSGYLTLNPRLTKLIGSLLVRGLNGNTTCGVPYGPTELRPDGM